MNYLVDIFPIEFDLTKYPLTSFTIKCQNPEEIGATYAARVRKMRQVPCAWIRDERRIVVPKTFTRQQAIEVLRQLQAKKLEGFDFVENIEVETDWQPSPDAIAQFIVRGVFDDAKGYLANALNKEEFKRGIIAVEREALLKGLVIAGQPALQIIVRSPMNSEQTFEHFYKAQGLEVAQGLSIKCKNTKGKFDGIKGNLGDPFGATGKTYRQQLIDWEPSDYDSNILGSLPDDHPVVGLLPYNGKKSYIYPIRVLRIIAEMGNLKKPLGLTDQQAKEVIHHLKIAPPDRRKLSLLAQNSLAKFCKQQYPAISIGESFSSVNAPIQFATADKLEFSTQLCFGSDVASVEKDADVLVAIKQHGLYKHAEWFPQRTNLRIAVIDAIAGARHFEDRTKQLTRFKTYLADCQLGIERSSDPLKVTAIDPTEQRAELTGKLHQLIRTQPDIIIIYLPNKDRLLGNNDPLSLYNTAKNVCIGAGVASQVIYEKTLLETKANADANIIMGILGKTGNIPYVLGEPLEYLDFVVGLDIARRANKNGGSINTAAMSRIYTNQGALLGYNIGPGALVEGETIPQSVLERILSPDEFSGKRVAIHRDGWFRGKEYEQIMNWGKYIKAEFYPIEVVKSGAARIYGETTNAHIIQATKGTAFGVNETLAYLVSSLPPSGKNGPFSTANPLQVNNRSRLTLQQALHSVLALTLLHYGSVRPPRLPVSTHASDKIASFLLRNIQPDKQKGDKPFWL